MKIRGGIGEFHLNYVSFNGDGPEAIIRFPEHVFCISSNDVYEDYSKLMENYP
jgi:hypothetical protein